MRGSIQRTPLRLRLKRGRLQWSRVLLAGCVNVYGLGSSPAAAIAWQDRERPPISRTKANILHLSSCKTRDHPKPSPTAAASHFAIGNGCQQWLSDICTIVFGRLHVLLCTKCTSGACGTEIWPRKNDRQRGPHNGLRPGFSSFRRVNRRKCVDRPRSRSGTHARD